jgi:hypothetical protein
MYVPKFKKIDITTYGVIITDKECSECGVDNAIPYVKTTPRRFVINHDGEIHDNSLFYQLKYLCHLIDLEKFIYALFTRIKKTSLIDDYIEILIGKIEISINKKGIYCRPMYSGYYHSVIQHVKQRYALESFIAKHETYVKNNLKEMKKIKELSDIGLTLEQ